MAKVKVQLAQGSNRVIDIPTMSDVLNAINSALASFTPASTATTSTSGVTAPLTANPTALVGLTPVDGSAFTAMRSDAAPELDQGIDPTWTGTHIFDNMITVEGHDVVLVTRQVATDGTTLTGGGDLSADRTLSIISSYVGQTSITTLGTITTGVWDGTAIAIAHGGTGQTTRSAALDALLPTQTSADDGYFLQTDGAGNVSWATATVGNITVLKGAAFASSTALTTGIADVFINCPVAGTIVGVVVFTSGGPGSCSIDVRKVAFASFPPTGSNSIVASAPPAISSGVDYEDTTLTGWTTAISAGDVLGFHLTSTSTFTNITVQLTVQQAA